MNAWLPVLIPATSLIAALIIFFLDEENRRLRTFVNLTTASLKVLLVVFLFVGVSRGEDYRFTLSLFFGFDIVLHADALSLLFVSLSALLWLVTTIYAIGYLDVSHGHDRSRFFGFFSLCVSATTAIALAGNLFTFLFFYELLTITTYPLVAHRGGPDAIKAGRVYLLYTLGGGALLLVAIVWLKSIVGAAEFVTGGMLIPFVASHQTELTIIFTMLIIGFGVKAALVPLHGWLPVAMVAPAPVSALLHAVAVVKAGAFGIMRTVYDVYGAGVCTELGVRPWLAAVAAFTIIYGSVRALRQDDFKRRLAYSTVSQVSYIILGAAIIGPVATIGGLVHIFHQGIMKITMFFVAGNLAEELHIKKVSQMNGIGRRMPITMASFTIAACAMIGIPPMAGFISKWNLGLGAIVAEQEWVVAVLLGSTMLNAAYFLPIVYRAWFKEPDVEFDPPQNGRSLEIHPYLLIPPLFTALCVLAAGIFAGMPFSPLEWAKLIALREYGL